MYYDKVISVVLAALLTGGTLNASPDRGGNDDRYGNRSDGKRSSTLERSRSTERSSHETRSTTRERYEPQRTDRAPASSGIRSDRAPTTSERPAARSGGSMLERSRDSADRHRIIQRTPAPVYRDSRPVTRPSQRVAPPYHRPLPHYHRPGYITRSLPSVALSIALGGLLFYYIDGIYYRHHTGGYIVAVPPVGLIVPRLPLGYTIFRSRGLTYYYYADVYYVWDGVHRGYRVVETPAAYVEFRPGDVVDILPDGAYSVTIDGVQYYRYRGVYFLQSIQRDRVVYIVVTP